MSGIYIHIPFCRSKCIYCAFYSRVAVQPLCASFKEALTAEILARRGEIPRGVETIYFGGGTPSLLEPSFYSELLGVIGSLLPEGSDALKEITLEVNPEDIDEEKAGEWAAAGINRVSMGVQSFHDSTLRKIGRRHSSAKIYEAFGILSRYFSNISIDLICGLPETESMWEKSVDEAVSLGAKHLSVYMLENEPGSALHRLWRAGKISLPGEEETAERFRQACLRIREAGYWQYEISNFAQPGFESVHNSSYWPSEPYIGFGPSAAGFDGIAKRRVNSPDIIPYINNVGNPPHDIEILSPEQQRIEFLLTRIRTREGIPVDEFASRFGKKCTADLLSAASGFVESGKMTFGSGCLSLTQEGIFIEDYILAHLV